MPDRSTKKGGVPWWAPLLLLAALTAGVAAAAVASQRGDGVQRPSHSVLGTQATLTQPTTTDATTTAAMTTAPRTITTTAAPPQPARRTLSSRAGHYVRERGSRVTSVVGNRIFWIARSDGSHVLVHLQGPGTRYAIRRGQRLSFTGVVTRNKAHSASAWGLTFAEGLGRFRAQRVHLEVFGPRIRFL